MLLRSNPPLSKTMKSKISILILFAVANVQAATTTWKLYLQNQSTNAVQYRIFERTTGGGGIGASGAFNWSGSIAAGARGLSGPDLYSYNAPDWGLYECWVQNPAGSGNVITNGNFYINNTGIAETKSVDFVWFGTTPVGNCVTNSQIFSIANNTPVTKTASWWINGQEVYYSAPGDGRIILKPGQSWSRTLALRHCDDGTSEYGTVGWYEDGITVIAGDDGFTFTNVPVETVFGGGGWTNGVSMGTNAVNSGGTNTGGAIGWASQTNAFITFNGTSATAARDDTLKAGFNVLAQQLNAIDGKLATIGAIGIENGGAGGEGGSSDAAIEAFHRDNTNLLTEISGKLSSTNYTGESSGTNSTAALDSADDIMGGIDSQGQGVLDGLGSAPGILGGGSSAGLSFDFMGQTLNLDPEVRFPGAATFFKSGIMLLVSLWLGRYLADLYLKTAAIYASSQTGGVPAIGPWGSLGVPIAVAVAIAVVTLWVAVFTVLFSEGLDYLSGVSATVSSFSTSNQTALYLINLFFPVSFLLSAAWTRMIAPVAVTKVIIMTASAQRFLLGK